MVQLGVTDNPKEKALKLPPPADSTVVVLQVSSSFLSISFHFLDIYFYSKRNQNKNNIVLKLYAPTLFGY